MAEKNEFRLFFLSLFVCAMCNEVLILFIASPCLDSQIQGAAVQIPALCISWFMFVSVWLSWAQNCLKCRQ